MTDGEVFAFLDVFRNVTRVFPIRGDQTDHQHLGMSYFKAMQRYPLDLVTRGAEVCIEHGKHFPKPTEWKANIPKPRGQEPEVLEMTAEESRQWHRAETLRYEDAPCRCRDCVGAGVQTRPIRYVPEFTQDDVERKVKDPVSQKVVIAGHWAHGDELVRWYRAKETFWTDMRAAVRQHSFPATTGYLKPLTAEQRIDAAFARRPPVEDREPGEDD